jgi:hypothetical protein
MWTTTSTGRLLHHLTSQPLDIFENITVLLSIEYCCCPLCQKVLSVLLASSLPNFFSEIDWSSTGLIKPHLNCMFTINQWQWPGHYIVLGLSLKYDMWRLIIKSYDVNSYHIYFLLYGLACLCHRDKAIHQCVFVSI